MPDDDELLASQQGMQRSVADVIATDESGSLDEFDDALWLSLSGLLERGDRAFDELPAGVRAYYSTRLIEWEVGNGGFTQAVYNTDEYLEAAAEGYTLFGDPQSADLMRRAMASQDEVAALEAVDAEVDGPPWNGVPWADEIRLAYVRRHRDEFRL